MPGGDGTGPGGRGPGTGWGMGPCGGRGFSRKGRGQMASPQSLTPEEELKMLKEERIYVDKRIAELEKAAKKN